MRSAPAQGMLHTSAGVFPHDLSVCCPSIPAPLVPVLFSASTGSERAPFEMPRCSDLRSLCILLCVLSRYILEGKELEFYMKKTQKKKGKSAAA